MGAITRSLSLCTISQITTLFVVFRMCLQVQAATPYLSMVNRAYADGHEHSYRCEYVKMLSGR
jgi:hypothetical protein